MLTAANIRLESGCEDKYLSLQRPPPNPYLPGVGGWKRWSHFIKVKRRIFVIAGSSFAPNPYCWDWRRKMITFALPYINKKYWIFDQHDDDVMLILWPGDFFDELMFILRSCLFNRIGHPWKPSCLCSGKCVWPSATPPPTSIPKHPTLFFTFGLLHFLILASHKIWYSVKLSQTDCENQLFLRYVRLRKGQTWARQVYHYYLTATLSSA